MLYKCTRSSEQGKKITIAQKTKQNKTFKQTTVLHGDDDGVHTSGQAPTSQPAHIHSGVRLYSVREGRPKRHYSGSSSRQPQDFETSLC